MFEDNQELSERTKLSDTDKNEGEKTITDDHSSSPWEEARFLFGEVHREDSCIANPREIMKMAYEEIENKQK